MARFPNFYSKLWQNIQNLLAGVVKLVRNYQLQEDTKTLLYMHYLSFAITLQATITNQCHVRYQ